jgi:hypothetical protein
MNSDHIDRAIFVLQEHLMLACSLEGRQGRTHRFDRDEDVVVFYL